MDHSEPIADGGFPAAQHVLGTLSPDQPGFFDRVRQHRLGPIAHALGMSGFRQDYLASLAVSEQRRVALEEIGAHLLCRNIEAVPIKGISYLGWLYLDPALRPMSDMDLLVPPSLHEQASLALESLDYRRIAKTGSRSRFHHATTFQRGRHYVDLHRNIVQPLRTSINADDLCDRKVPGDTFSRLTRIDAALVHFAHLARSELNVPALNYLDGALLLARLSDDELRQLTQRAKLCRMGHGVHWSIEMTRSVTEPEHQWTPVGMRAKVLPLPGEILSRRHPPRPLQILRKLALCDDLRSGLGLVVGALIERTSRRRDATECLQ